MRHRSQRSCPARSPRAPMSTARLTSAVPRSWWTATHRRRRSVDLKCSIAGEPARNGATFGPDPTLTVVGQQK